MQEDEMTYVEGGAAVKYTNMTGVIMNVLIGAGSTGVAGVASMVSSVRAIAQSAIISVSNILLRYCSGIVGMFSLTWAATEIVAAAVYLYQYGYYKIDSIFFGALSYVTH
jgi:hypothetical protein